MCHVTDTGGARKAVPVLQGLFCFSNCFISVIKYLPRSNVKKEGFIRMQQLEKPESTMMGKAMGAVRGEGSHSVPSESGALPSNLKTHPPDSHFLQPGPASHRCHSVPDCHHQLGTNCRGHGVFKPHHSTPATPLAAT